VLSVNFSFKWIRIQTFTGVLCWSLLVGSSSFAVDLSQENFYEAINSNPEASYILVADIDISTIDNGSPPGGVTVFDNFSGNFDGGGKTISGLTTPLFNNLEASSIVSNLTLETLGTLSGKGILANNSETGSVVENVTASGDVDGGNASSVGGLIGNSSSIIRNSNMSGSVESLGDSVGGLVGYSNALIENSSTTNITVTGQQYVGGLVGYTAPGGSIVDSHSELGEVNGGNSVGGLVGAALGPITNSFAKELEINETLSSGSDCSYSCFGGLVGIVGDGTADIANSYSRVNVYAPSGNYVGGLVGGISSGDIVISKTYSIGETTGQDYVGGLIGGTLYPSNFPNITDSHAQVTVGGRAYVGGFIGYFDDSNISNSYASSVVSSGDPVTSGAFSGSANGTNSSTLTRVSASGLTPVENDNDEAKRDALFGERSGAVEYTGPIEYYQGSIESTDLFASLGLNWSLNPAINNDLPYITDLECSYVECDSDSPPYYAIASNKRIILSKETNAAFSEVENFTGHNKEISKDCYFKIIDSSNSKVSNLSRTYISKNEMLTSLRFDQYLDLGEKLQYKIVSGTKKFLNLWIESENCDPIYLGYISTNKQVSTDDLIATLPAIEFSKLGRFIFSIYDSNEINSFNPDLNDLYTQIYIWVQ
jgi:hypothetical protein